MIKKIVAVWVSLAMLFGFIVIVDVITDFTPTVRATTLYVNETGSGGAYTSIQDAINAANAGDTVFVYNGTYIERVDLNKAVNLMGEDRSNTTINMLGSGTGIYVTADDVYIRGFNITNGDYGIHLYETSNNKIYDNTISGTQIWGMFLQDALNIDVKNNTFIRDGIIVWATGLSYCNSHTIENNTANGLPIYYYKNSNGITVPDDAGIVILANCNNFDIKGHNFTEVDIAIVTAFSDNNHILDNNISYCNNEAIYMYFSSFNIISGNNISYYDYGISISGGSFNNISDNDIHHSQKIFAGVGIISHHEISINITGNEISFNENSGCHLVQSDYNSVINNYIHNNNGVGIYFQSSSDNNNAIDNILNTNKVGLQMLSSYNNIIIGNILSSNYQYGIRLITSSNNYIYHNQIITNSNQSYDDMNNNYWDNGYPSGGNYWSDFDESGEGAYDDYNGSNQDISGSDGIVDNGSGAGGGKNPYVIDADSQDNYPLIEPFGNFFILNQGWNLISIPLIQDNQDLLKVLEMIDGYYDVVQWYNPTDLPDPWKHHKVSKSFGNDLFELNETMGFWIHITNPGDTIFLYNGTQPTQNQSITLYPGWNMVGYPSLTSYNRTEGLNNLTFNDQVDAIWTYDAATQKWEEMGESDYFEIGKGYYIHAKSECEWEVPL